MSIQYCWRFPWSSFWIWQTNHHRLLWAIRILPFARKFPPGLNAASISAKRRCTSLFPSISRLLRETFPTGESAHYQAPKLLVFLNTGKNHRWRESENPSWCFPCFHKWDKNYRGEKLQTNWSFYLSVEISWFVLPATTSRVRQFRIHRNCAFVAKYKSIQPSR